MQGNWVVIGLIGGLGLPALLFAAPAIDEVTGTLGHGAAITIRGTGFGSKPTAAPYIWDTLEDGDKSDPATLGTWSENTCSDGVTSTLHPRHPRSVYNVGSVFAGSTSSVTFDMSQGKTAHMYYGGYWFYLGPGFDFCPDFAYPNRLANLKILRFYSTAMANLTVVIHSGQLNWGQEVCPGGSLTYTGWSADDHLARDAWHHLEAEFKASGVDQPDGVLRIWIDGKLRIQDTALLTNCSGSNGADGWDMDNMGFYDSWTDAECGGSSNVAHFDDLYADTTWSRVFLGDASDCGLVGPAMCGHREIQPATAWSDTAVTVALNTGSFPAGATVYLFVVDEGGQSSTGYPITLDGTTLRDTVAPADPKGLSAK